MDAIFPLFLSCWTANEWSTSSMEVPLTMTTLSFSLQTENNHGAWATPIYSPWIFYAGTEAANWPQVLIKGLSAWRLPRLNCCLSLGSDEGPQESPSPLLTVYWKPAGEKDPNHRVSPGATRQPEVWAKVAAASGLLTPGAQWTSGRVISTWVSDRRKSRACLRFLKKFWGHRTLTLSLSHPKNHLKILFAL